MSSDKKYGLILPGKTRIPIRPAFQASRNVFGSDSESDGEISKKKPMLLRASDKINRQAKINQEKAVTEDPTVYQYDEIYDTMVNKKEEAKKVEKQDKKPKYIENLIKSANKRKIENELRLERQIQKEREKEGDEFADKEVFVTSAYKKKLEEIHLEEEKAKREEYLEGIGDVTKQCDLGGFYRHLYEQKLGKTNVNELPVGNVEHSNLKDKNIAAIPLNKSKKRNYRQRKSSLENESHLSEGEIEDSDDEVNRLNLNDIKLAKKNKDNVVNLDADSDFSIDGSSDDNNDKSKESDKVLQQPNVQSVDKKNDSNVNKSPENKIPEETVKPKEKIDIWKKRTVGQVFEDALKRYYERKAARGTR